MSRALPVVMVLMSTACAASPRCPPATSPAQQVAPAAPSDVESLPTYFGIELRADGSLWLGGETVASVAALRERAAVALTEVEGAAIYVEHGADAGTLSEVVQVLIDVGYRRLRSVPGPAPEVWSSAEEAPPEPAQPVTSAEPTEKLDAEATPEPKPPMAADVPRDVVVTTRGLHIGGGPNDDDEVKAVFINAVEAREADFRRCHRLAEDRLNEGSFGVDLFIERGGGPPKIRDTRTGMGGQDFRACVLEVFSEIEFESPPTGKPTVISYSILFKPQR